MSHRIELADNAFGADDHSTRCRFVLGNQMRMRQRADSEVSSSQKWKHPQLRLHSQREGCAANDPTRHVPHTYVQQLGSDAPSLLRSEPSELQMVRRTRHQVRLTLGHDFREFLKDMGECPSPEHRIDRKDLMGITPKTTVNGLCLKEPSVETPRS